RSPLFQLPDCPILAIANLPSVSPCLRGEPALNPRRMHQGGYADTARGPASCPNLTDTTLETPGSCMVTPYITAATALVFLLWVMMMNWVSTAMSLINSVKRPMLASSRGASTSSRMQNGLGWYLKIPTSNARAVRAFSPPESSRTFCSFLPGGEATTSIPL